MHIINDMYIVKRKCLMSLGLQPRFQIGIVFLYDFVNTGIFWNMCRLLKRHALIQLSAIVSFCYLASHPGRLHTGLNPSDIARPILATTDAFLVTSAMSRMDLARGD